MRPIWTGSIGFGLVNIPVKLYSATRGSEIDLDMLDSKDHANIKFQRVNANTGKIVPYEDIVKGYKMDRGYVVLDEKDFEAVAVKKSKVIEIEDFVDINEVDDIYFETPYYVEPDKSSYRSYGLLVAALKKTKKVGVATFVMRNKEHLAIVKPKGNMIILHMMRFAEEIRDTGDLDIPDKVEVKPRELEIAISLIDQQTDKFKIEKYTDTYSEELLKIIKKKSKGAKITPAKLQVEHLDSGDLMSQLKASLLKKIK